MHAHTLRPDPTLPADTGGDDGAPPPIDYRPLRDAARLALSWAFAVARTSAPEPDDQEAIDRVKRASFATLAGMPLCCRPDELRASEQDVLVTAAALIDRFEIDFNAPGLSQVAGALYDAFGWSQRAAPRPAVAAIHRRAGHAVHRHADPTATLRTLAAQLARAPRLAHGEDEAPLARILILPRR